MNLQLVFLKLDLEVREQYANSSGTREENSAAIVFLLQALGLPLISETDNLGTAKQIITN